MTCDEVRDLLPEHLLGTLEGPEDLEVRRHLRGCAACREERMKLEEGVSALSRAVHDQEPPAELRDRVRRTLGEEWEEAGRVPATPASSPRNGRDRSPWLAVAAAAAVILIVGSVAFGFAQAHRASLAAADASVAAADAQSYRNLLDSLGGREFRIGELKPAQGSAVHGQVLLYDGDPERGWSSWGIVFAKVPGYAGEATATLLAADGDSLALGPLHIEDGEGTAWLVTHDDITQYDRLTITSPNGQVMATAAIEQA
jgi:Putative zinc-finger